MTTAAELQIAVETTGANTATSVLQQLASQGQRTERATDALTDAIQDLVRQGRLTEQAVNRLDDSLGQLESQAEETTRATDELNNELDKISAGAVAAASAFAVASIAFVKSAAAQAKEMKNLARIANTSYEDFQAYAHAVKSVGVSAEGLATISQDLRDKLGEFLNTGGGEFADFFELVAPQVGLTAEALQGLSGPKALLAVKKAMDDANVSAEQQVTYLEAIASDASLLTPLLENNGAALNKMASEAYNLGGVLSELDSKSLLEAAKASGEFETAFEGLTSRIAAEFAPAITGATQSATAVLVKLNEMLASGELQGYLTVVASLLAGRLSSSLIAAARSSGVFASAQAAAAGSMRVTTIAANGLRGALALLGGPVGIAVAAASAIAFYATSADKATPATQELRTYIDELTASYEQLTVAGSKAALLKLDKSLPALKKQQSLISAQLETQRHNLRYANKRAEAQDNIIKLEDRLEQATKRVNEALKLREQIVERIKSGAPTKKAERKTEKEPEENKAFDRLKRSLEEEIALYGNSSKAARLSYKLKANALGEFTDDQKSSIRGYIDQLAKLEEKAGSNKALEKSKKQMKRLSTTREKEFTKLQDYLKSEEELILSSYDKRLNQILEKTRTGSKLQQDLLGRLNKKFATSVLDGFRSSPKTKSEKLAELKDEYDRRHDLITKKTRSTEEEKNRLIEQLAIEHKKRIDEIEKNSEFNRLRNALKTEPDRATDLFHERLKTIDESGESEEEKDDLRGRATKQYATDVLGDLIKEPSIDEKIEKIREEEALKREAILAETEITQTQKDELIERLEEGSKDKIKKLEDAKFNERLSASSQFFGDMTDLAKVFAGEQSGIYKGLFAVTKAHSIAKATLKAHELYMEAAASAPPPANAGPIAVALAQGAAGIAKVTAVNFAGAYDKGGHIPAGKFGLVGEYGPEFINGPANVTSRKDTTKMLEQASQKTEAAPPPQVNVKNIIVQDPSIVGDYLETSDDAERQIMNIVRRNQGALS